ncbi:hypothetical protein EBF04_14085 [Streptomyces sp. I6]|nr:hypothetical protein EBF04_14085 [Streptomyces sp. I6]
MRRAPANALPLLLFSVRYAICFSTSQLATFRVPPYRPGCAPLTATVREPILDVLGPDGAAAFLVSVATEGVNGSRPAAAAV